MARVIAIDGPSGAGKGTVAKLVAKKLGYHLLDSGALYRILGYAAKQTVTDTNNGAALALLASKLDIAFEASTGEGVDVLLAGENVSRQIRSQQGAEYASKVAVHPEVRTALLSLQQSFAKEPGLVADGRDMGTEVFKNADLKVFLTASAEERARRRYKQLNDKGENVSIARLLDEIQQRDERDANRDVAPLRPAEDSVLIDSTTLSIDEVVNLILSHVSDLK